MHLRWSSVIGMPVLDDQTQEVVAFLTDPLIDPDTGRILGFYVSAPSGVLFLPATDILSIGTKVHIRSSQKLSPPDELIRLREKLEDERSFLGQTIRNRETGRSFGTCADLQFETHHFAVEWLFPKRLFFFRQPISASEILEVTKDAIWVKDSMRTEKGQVSEKRKEPVVSLVPEIAASMSV